MGKKLPTQVAGCNWLAILEKNLCFCLLAFGIFLVGFTQGEATQILKDKGIPVTERSLADAYLQKDLAGMDLLIDAGVNVDARGEKDVRYFENMIIASGENIVQKEECKKLALKMLEKGANPNATKADTFSPLMYAAMSHAYEIAELLVKKGADVNYGNDNHETAIVGALAVNDVKMVKFLLAHGAKKNGTGAFTSYTPFEELVEKTGNKELIELLVPKKNKVLDKVEGTFFLAGVLGFLFNGVHGMFVGFVLVLFLPIVALLVIGLALTVIGTLFRGATDAMVESKVLNVFGWLERFISLLPAVSRTLKDEEEFKARLEAKYKKGKKTSQ